MSKYKLPKVEELLDSGVHFGHQVRRWHPKMEPYIYSVRKNIHIIDLEQTEQKLKEACDFLFETAKRGEQVIFVGTKKQAREVIELEAKRSGALYVTERWIGGTITNFKIIKKNIEKLLGYLKRKEEGDLDKYTKKERLLIDREIEKMQRNIGGIVGLKGDPGAMFLVDAKREKTALREANRAGVPVVGLVDTNSDPEGIQYVIPGNDDAIKSIAVILKAISHAVEEGYKEFAAKQSEKEQPATATEDVQKAKVEAVKKPAKTTRVKTEDKAVKKEEV
jgi:small subunit ribosomal protein S2